MTFFSKLSRFGKLAVPVTALVLWAGPVAADSLKDAAGSGSWPPVELYKSISPSLPMPQSSGEERETASQMVRPLAAPANDDFADAIALQGQSGTVSANVDATSEPGEPAHAVFGGISSVWYTIRANQSVVVTLDTFSSDLDTVLAVYTGNRVNNLTEVVSNDDFDFPGNVLQSRVIFVAEAGTIYRIAVDGFGGEQGNFTLNFERIDLSPNDSFDDAIALEGRSGSLAGNNLNATSEPGSHPTPGSLGSARFGTPCGRTVAAWSP